MERAKIAQHDNFSPRNWLDEAYYSAQCGLIGSSKSDLMAHYRTIGWKKGYDPHPLFSTEHYIACYPQSFTQDICPVDHWAYLDENQKVLIAPSCFDPQYYAGKASITDLGLRAIVEHYVNNGNSLNIGPNALFSPHYYRKQLASRAGRTDLYRDYISRGAFDGRSPHPLFDIEFYERASDNVGIPHLLHYLKVGWREGRSPHILFDPEYFTATCGYAVDGPPLLSYLNSTNGDLAPHYLFSDAFYLSSFRAANGGLGRGGLGAISPLQHFVEIGASFNIPTHPLFDGDFYCKSYERHVRGLGGSFDANWTLGTCLVRHFLTVGEQLGLSTTPLIDIDHLSQQMSVDRQSRPLRIYLLSAYQYLSPHPALDFEYFCEQATEYNPLDVSVLLYLLALPKEDRPSPNPVFDVEFYLKDNGDVRENGLCPVMHYLQYGFYEGRKPNALYSHLYSHHKASREITGFNPPVETYFKLGHYRQPALIFLVHDASRTGAPMIALNLIREISKLQGIECYTILGAGGPLVHEFVKASHAYVLKGYDRGFLDWFRHSSSFLDEMKLVLGAVRNVPLAGVVCNSLESRHLADYLRREGLGPLTSLIHEAADSYQAKQVLDTIAMSDRVVFPSQYTLDRSLKVGRLDLEKIEVFGQGLLSEGFGRGSRRLAKEEICRRHSIPEDSQIVLGCGTANKRKGIDLFVDAACKVLDDCDHRLPYFVWLGEGAAHHDSAYWWATRQIEEHGYRDYIKMAGQMADTEPYYLSADLFVLSSRIDPFPCVAHEAMASGLPILAFEGASGSVEFAGDACRAVPMDSSALADEIKVLLADDTTRRAMGERARSIIENDGDFRSYASRVWDIVSDISPRSESLPSFQRAAPRHKGTVYFLTPDWQVSGVNTFTETLVGELVDRGYDAKILFTRGSYTYKTDADKASFPQVPYEFLEPRSDRPDDVWDELHSFFNERRTECVLVPNYDYIASSVFPALPPHVRFVGILHSDDDEHYEHGYRLGPYWDRIVCVSSYIRDQLVALNRSFEEKTSTIHYGIEFDAEHSRARLKERIKSIDGRPLRLLYVGRLVEKQKRIRNYIRLLRLLEKADVDYEMTFIGDGDMATVMTSALSDLIEAKRVKMLGRLPPNKVKDVMAESDILLLLSDFEGLPLSVLEASSMGCVPVAWKLDSGIPDLIKSGRNGFAVTKGDFEELVDLLARLAGDRRRLATVAKATLKNFENSDFTAEHMSDRYEAIFAEVLSNWRDARRPKPFTEYRGGATPPIWMRRIDA